jgi:large subunit ribosomal protein L4
MIASSLNAYKVLNADVLVVTENSVKAIDETLTK